jgi:hypothetical protein
MLNHEQETARLTKIKKAQEDPLVGHLSMRGEYVSHNIGLREKHS